MPPDAVKKALWEEFCKVFWKTEPDYADEVIIAIVIEPPEPKVVEVKKEIPTE
jgi:hypothetical protein